MKFLVFLLLALSGAAFAQQTVTIPAQTVTVTLTIPAQTVTVVGAPPTPVTCTAPQVLQNGVCVTPVLPPPSGVAWVFHNGAFGPIFGGDYSYGSGSVSYTSKDPVTGETVVGIFGDEGWQPFFIGNDFYTVDYNFVLVSLKPIVAGAGNWTTGAEAVGDTPIPGGPPLPPAIAQYCGAFTVGQWTACKIPLTLYGPVPYHLYKVAFQQHGTVAANGGLSWEAKELGISP